jgi:hypothetical protein
MNDLPICHIRELDVAGGEMVLQFANHPLPSIRRSLFGVVAGQNFMEMSCDAGGVVAAISFCVIIQDTAS